MDLKKYLNKFNRGVNVSSHLIGDTIVRKGREVSEIHMSFGRNMCKQAFGLGAVVGVPMIVTGVIIGAIFEAARFSSLAIGMVVQLPSVVLEKVLDLIKKPPKKAPALQDKKSLQKALKSLENKVISVDSNFQEEVRAPEIAVQSSEFYGKQNSDLNKTAISLKCRDGR